MSGASGRIAATRALPRTFKNAFREVLQFHSSKEFATLSLTRD